jgi:choline dehydrogenase-like flavoprotein
MVEGLCAFPVNQAIIEPILTLGSSLINFIGNQLYIMENEAYDYIIAGMGAGGATLARELTLKGKQVLAIESGNYYEEAVGTFLDTLHYFDLNKLTRMPPRTRSGVNLWRTNMVGGTTMVSTGNGVRCLEKELAEMGIFLNDEFREAEQEMSIKPYNLHRLTSNSKRLREASFETGYGLEAMPKFIDPKKCRRCGNCQMGCLYGAKWTALNYVKEAQEHGLKILSNTRVERVNIENGIARSVTVIDKTGNHKIFGNRFILAAGGMGTAPILQRSGIEEAGSQFFLDLFVNTYGLMAKTGKVKEPKMALVHTGTYEKEGLILSSMSTLNAVVSFIEMGVSGTVMPKDRTIGIMTKIRDDSAGSIDQKGKIRKQITSNDHEKLSKGIRISKKILNRAGIRERTIRVTRIQGAHPGGTAAIGKVVNRELQTKIKNLFICDSSVLPASPGLPPILTIVALAKRLSKIMA